MHGGMYSTKPPPTKFEPATAPGSRIAIFGTVSSMPAAAAMGASSPSGPLESKPRARPLLSMNPVASAFSQETTNALPSGLIVTCAVLWLSVV
jgi:hypothetical protein